MRRLRNTSITPPDPEYFTYVDRDTGNKTTHMVYRDWVEKAIEHRQAMGLDVPANFSAIMEDQLCSKLSPDWCSYEKEGSKSWVDARLSLADVVGFTKTMFAHMMKREYVPQAEATRRAAICASCYYNVTVSGCGACRGLAEVLAPNRSTPYDNQLQSCGVCKCYNRAQVHFDLATLEASDTSEKQATYPDFCWHKRNGYNYLDGTGN